MITNVVFVPLPSEIYNEFVLRFGDATKDVAGTIEYVLSDYLERTKDEAYWGTEYLAKRDAARMLEEIPNNYGALDKGYQWLIVFLPNGTKLKMAYKGRDYYAEVAHEKIMYQGEAFSPSGLANRIASGTRRNAWRDFWIKRPRDKGWLLANDLRRNGLKGLS